MAFRTYTNQASLAHSNPASLFAACPDCTGNYSPNDPHVCASDGKSYEKTCEFVVTQCEDPTVKKVHDGKCHSKPKGRN